jgi:universal stress protein A
MFSSILVPTDLTDRTVPALEIAARLVAGPKPRLTLIHVIEAIQDASFEELAAFYRQLETKARARMADLAIRGAPHRPVDQVIVYGRRADEIVRFAVEHKTDLIVIASHRIDRESDRPDWGTISYKVGILSPCPVLLVK